MAFSLPSGLSNSEPSSTNVLNQDIAPKRYPVSPAPPTSLANSEDTLADLRHKLDDDSHSPDSLIGATADAARTLTTADGVAIALRSRGAVVCRARSGELAPDLGTPLNLHSGISGECLRSASILLCNDALNDSRVDAEVCRTMGIASLIVVPLRGVIGTAGILEAFSTHPNAFGEEQIEILRELAKIAEAAYQRERRAQEEEMLAQLRGRRLPNLFSRGGSATSVTELRGPSLDEVVTDGSDSFSIRKYWVLGMLALAVLLILGVWLSWRSPMEDLSAAPRKTTSQPSASSVDHAPPSAALVSNLKAAAVVHKQDRQAIVKKAAEIESADANDVAVSTISPATARRVDVREPSPPRPPSDSGEDAPAPQVVMNSEGNNAIAALVSDSESLPAMGAEVSKGITPAELVHKVEPIYPMQARAQRISGSVLLEATIGVDGHVRKVKTIRGDALLAGSAREAVQQWRYNPVLLNGKPIEAVKQITVLFKLP